MSFYLRKDTQPKVQRYSYPISAFAGIDALSNESSMPLTYASYGYNICMEKGVLKNGVGVGLAKINNEYMPSAGSYGLKILKIFHYYRYDYATSTRDDRMIALLDDKKIYVSRLTDQSFTPTSMDMESGNVTFINYHYQDKDCLLIFSDAGKMYIYDGENATNIGNAPKLNSACIHFERVYGTMNIGNNRLYFSDELDPTNWNVSLSEGGYISFPDEGGKVNKVISFKNSLYIFREYGIHRLTTFADQTDYALSKVYTTNNLIFDKTVAVCNNFIVFLAEDGLYRFDGSNCQKVLREVTPLIVEKTYSTACFFNNKYYLATAIKRDDVVVGDEHKVLKNNAIIMVDFDINDVSIFRGSDIREFVPLNLDYCSELLVTFNHLLRALVVGMVNDTGTLFGLVLAKKWCSPYTDLNYLNKDKVLRRIFISSDSAITLRAKLDKVYSYNVYSNYKAQMIVVNKKTDKIGLEVFTTEHKFALRGMILEFDVIKRSIYDGDY